VNGEESTIAIGNVLRADIRGYVIASRIPEPQVPTFGTFVRAPIQQEQGQLIGLVYDIRLQDDPFLRNLAVTLNESNPDHQEIIADQQERAIPVEISVAAVGYCDREERYHYGLPPQPPMVLRQISVCSEPEVAEIIAHPDWMQPLLDNREVPTDPLITRRLQRNAEQFGEPGSTEHEAYLLEAARYLARHLAREPLRLETILRQLVE
jgi:hypothetical protein